LTLQGAAQASATNRLFRIDDATPDAVTVIISGLTLTGGNVSGGGAGGGLSVANEAVTLSNVALTGNHSDGDGGAASGQGGSLTLTNCSLTNNTAQNGGA